MPTAASNGLRTASGTKPDSKGRAVFMSTSTDAMPASTTSPSLSVQRLR